MPAASDASPDLAPLISMVLLGNRPLFGPPPAEVLDPVPHEDLIHAIVAGIPGLLDDLESDAANVVLTLARIWATVATGAIHTKDVAADWVLPRLPDEHRAVLARARAVYLGDADDKRWGELQSRLRPHAEFVVQAINLAVLGGAGFGSMTERGLRVNDRFRRDILDLLARSGPLLSRDIPDTSQVAWPSSGWTNSRNVTQMLEFLMMRGEIAIAGRRGRERLWDLPERVYPPGTPVVPADEARRIRDERRLRSLGIAREKGTALPGEAAIVGQAGEPATVEGVAGTWRVDPEAMGKPFEGRTALLSPFDRLIYDRARAIALFDFEYVLEMYKPKAKRRWGYFALPVLHHDRLVGKVDATADRKGSRLDIHAVHRDVPFTPVVTDAVHDELDALAQWLGLESVRHP